MDLKDYEYSEKTIFKYVPLKISGEFEKTFQMRIIRLVQNELNLPEDLPIKKINIFINANKPIEITLTTDVFVIRNK